VDFLSCEILPVPSGRGSLHLHLLLWLVGAPTSSQMHELLQTETFRTKMCTFFRGSISAHVDGISDGQLLTESVETRKLHKQRASAYSRPLDPHNVDFPKSAGMFIRSLMRTLQVHVHSSQSCLSMGSKGNLKYKRHGI
jgi:hypothetical protein